MFVVWCPVHRLEIGDCWDRARLRHELFREPCHPAVHFLQATHLRVLGLLKTEALNNLCFTDVPIILTAKALLIKFEAIGEDDIIVNFPV